MGIFHPGKGKQVEREGLGDLPHGQYHDGNLVRFSLDGLRDCLVCLSKVTVTFVQCIFSPGGEGNILFIFG